MAIDLSYLMPEVREGFYIPSEIKQAWAAELEVLKEVDRICIKHNIPYQAEWGTLLGAVRHGGFIPWDDDLDISMARPDYERFLKIAPRELPEGFSVYNYRNHDNFRQFISRVTSAERISFDKEHLKRFAGFPFMSGLDVFVLDYVNKDDELEEERINEANFVLSFADCLYSGSLSNSEIKDHFKTIKEKYGVEIESGASDWEIQKTLFALTDKIISRFSKEESKGLIQIAPLGLKCPGRCIPFEKYEKTIRRPFESVTVPIPVFFDDMLKFRYGNYLTPVTDVSGHNYPYFESQKEELNKAAGENLFDYSFDKNDILDVHKDKDLSYKSLVKECISGFEAMAESINKGEYGILPDLQQLVIDLGNLTESVLGKGTTTVSKAEKLCETIFLCHESSNRSNLDVSILLKELNALIVTVREEILSKRFVLFLYSKREDFEYLRVEYERYANASDAYVFVASVSWGYKDYDGSLYDLRNDETPEGVYAVPFEDIQYDLLQPDITFTTDAFDNRNPVFSVLPSCYTKALKEYTDRLIYIPPYKTDDFDKTHARAYKNLKYYLAVPGVIRCDEIHVWSSQIRDTYIEKLTEFAGEEKRDLWSDKIKVKNDENEVIKKEEKEKHLLVFFDSATIIAYGDKAHRKIRRVVETLKENESCLKTVWYIPQYVSELLSKDDLDKLNVSLNALTSKLQAVIETDPDIVKVTKRADAYYGDPSIVSEYMRYLKKPVMIANLEVGL